MPHFIPTAHPWRRSKAGPGTVSECPSSSPAGRWAWPWVPWWPRRLVDWGGLSATVYAVVFGCLVAFLIRRNINGRPVPQEGKSQGAGTLPTGYGLLFGLGILSMIRALVILGFQTFVPLYLTELGTPLPTVGLTLFVFWIAGGIGGLTGGTWAERIGEKGVLFASFLIPIPLFLGYLLLGTSVVGIACFGLAGYSIFTGVPILIAISQRSFPRRVGTISSFVMGVSGGMGAIGIYPGGNVRRKIRALLDALGSGADRFRGIPGGGLAVSQATRAGDSPRPGRGQGNRLGNDLIFSLIPPGKFFLTEKPRAADFRWKSNLALGFPIEVVRLLVRRFGYANSVRPGMSTGGTGRSP